MYTFTGDNPSVLQVKSFFSVLEKGSEVKPRGKRIKELRPSTFEFQNPYRRFTFMRGRKVNPFFTLAESLWIISGRSDVQFLDAFNKNMKSFSDDGQFFNASYGERLRAWGSNKLHEQLYNPVDQMYDAYYKLKEDPDTRQAVMVISNPHFDNSRYTVLEKGKDIACNLVITFKIRDGKLHMTVFNRSNDHCYGLFGANLCQFTTIMETMSAWLGLPCGTYTHITDSLHLYLDDYGSKTNQEILDEHKSVHSDTKDADLEEAIYFETDQEPRMSLDYQGTNEFLSVFWGVPAAILVGDNTKSILELAEFVPKITKDTYWQNAIYSMIVYRLVRLGNLQDAMKVLHDYVVPYSGKVSMLYFLKDRVYASGVPEIIKSYEDDVAKIKTHLINSEEAGKSLEKYLLK